MPRLKLSSLIGIALAVSSAVAGAQVRKIKVVGPDSTPIMYAYVAVEGGDGKISDENGEVNLGPGKRQTLSLRVQRIGYKPWFGKIELPDTAATLLVLLPRLGQTLSTIKVQAAPETRALQLTGFYDRWMMRQKGTVSAVFIGPEELESRHPDKITNMLNGLNGVRLQRSCEGAQVAFNGSGQCQMAIVVDGTRQCPSGGCKSGGTGSTLVPSQNPGLGQRKVSCDSPALLDAVTAVLIDQILEANDVTAIEIYNRGGNVPSSLSVSDQSCGIIAFWTGARKP
jgi:hypothetical protein